MPGKDSGYKSALKFIFDREHFGIKLGIENISRFLNCIDNPHQKFQSVHIAGTNGKGSTASFLYTIVKEAGYKAGIFTSPHLADFRERIKVDGRQISRQFIARFIKEQKDVIEKNKVTFFEVCTALAFAYFASKKVDLAIVEVGLGGRLDATNTLSPLLSIITDISFDHTNILGKTLKKIAFEKAGIIKKKIPLIIGSMPPEARHEIIRVGRIRKAPFDYIKPSSICRNGGNMHFDYHGNDYSINKLKCSLPGKHQMKNGANAIRSVEWLNKFGFKIDRRAIRRGLKKAVWPGRFQILKQPNKATLILDVGHNRAGLKAFADTFNEIFPNRKAKFIIGFVRFKNLFETVKHIFPIAESVEITRLDTYRSADPAEIARLFLQNRIPVTVSNSLTVSARRIIKESKPDDIVIIGGSHFAVGEFMANRSKIL